MACWPRIRVYPRSLFTLGRFKFSFFKDNVTNLFLFEHSTILVGGTTSLFATILRATSGNGLWRLAMCPSHVLLMPQLASEAESLSLEVEMAPSEWMTCTSLIWRRCTGQLFKTMMKDTSWRVALGTVSPPSPTPFSCSTVASAVKVVLSTTAGSSTQTHSLGRRCICLLTGQDSGTALFAQLTEKVSANWRVFLYRSITFCLTSSHLRWCHWKSYPPLPQSLGFEGKCEIEEIDEYNVNNYNLNTNRSTLETPFPLNFSPSPSCVCAWVRSLVTRQHFAKSGMTCLTAYRKFSPFAAELRPITEETVFVCFL